jgi:hypothetical protein
LATVAVARAVEDPTLLGTRDQDTRRVVLLVLDEDNTVLSISLFDEVVDGTVGPPCSPLLMSDDVRAAKVFFSLYSYVTCPGPFLEIGQMSCGVVVGPDELPLCMDRTCENRCDTYDDGSYYEMSIIIPHCFSPFMYILRTSIYRIENWPGLAVFQGRP